jgi:hypothetical protein
MKRFLIAWGPPLLGAAIATGAGMGIVACIMGAHWMLMVPAVGTTVTAFFASLTDLLDSRPARRLDDLGRRLRDGECTRCAALRKDCAELREALAVLKLPEGE